MFGFGAVENHYLADIKGPVYVALRRGGARIASAWADGKTTALALENALAEAMARTGESADAVEISFSDDYEAVARGSGSLTNVHRGILGLQVDSGNKMARYSPTLLIEQNWDFERAIQQFLHANKDVNPARINLQMFTCDQALVTLGQQPRAIRMRRGNTLIDVADLNQAATRQLSNTMTAWLRRNVSAKGKMLYKYWPSRQETSDTNNMIRQWMATLALIRSGSDNELIKRNIEFNLANYYQCDDQLGLIIEPDGDVKLECIWRD